MDKNEVRLQISRKRLRIGVLTIIISSLLFIQLIFQYPAEIPKFRGGIDRILSHIFSLFGLFNHAMYRLVGIGVYIVPFFLLIWGLHQMKRKGSKKRIRQELSTFVGIIILSILAGLYDLVLGSESDMSGGRLGHGVISFLYNIVGLFFTILLVAVLVWFYICEVRQIPLNRSVQIFGRFIQKNYKRILNWIAAGMDAVGVVLKGRKTRTTPGEAWKPPRREREPRKPMEQGRKPEVPLSGPIIQERKRIFEICESNQRKKFVSDVPDVSLLESHTVIKDRSKRDALENRGRRIEAKLRELNLDGEILGYRKGPLVTQYELRLAPGIKISQFMAVADDLALTLGEKNICLEIPLVGKNTIGIEIPNSRRRTVYLTEILHHHSFSEHMDPLWIAMGVDILGQPVFTQIDQMPHLLIAGATGSGKSVFLNAMICQLLFKNNPDTLRMICIDPKRVELAAYERIPHLLCPILLRGEEVEESLEWLIHEMEKRYSVFSNLGIRDLKGYNEHIQGEKNRLAYILLIVDELVDLMLGEGKSFEKKIVRLAQKGRAVGIHLILATQRPSVDVVTGLLKANFPSRISFKVASVYDSRVILDEPGAEKLMDRGDMLFKPISAVGLKRLHGMYISSDEIDKVVDYWSRRSQ